MDIFWMIVSVLLMLAGLVGCVLPMLPGPPLSFFALLVLQLRTEPPFSTPFLVTWAMITIIVTIVDYFIPVYTTKKFGGSNYGVWGCMLGLIAGFWLGPLGIIVGPLLGAFIGEMLANQNSDQAFRAALGSFLGFVAGTVLKLVVCAMMGWHLVKACL
jgi:hypothetical protein